MSSNLFTRQKFDTPRHRIIAAPASTVVRYVDDVKRHLGNGPARRFAHTFLSDIREQLNDGWRSHLTPKQTTMLLRAADAAGVTFENHKVSKTEKESGSHVGRQSR